MNILLIDDMMEDWKILADILEDDGHSVVTAENGKEGVDLLAQHDIELVVTDTDMPIMTGMEVIDYMHKHYQDIPIILMSVNNKYREWADSKQVSFLWKQDFAENIDVLNDLVNKIC